MAEERASRASLWLGLVPLALLGAMLGWLLGGGAVSVFRTELPPVEQLYVSRHVLEPDRIVLHVVNAGPDPVTVAQVMVRGAFWSHEVVPARTLQPLERGQVVIPYPWNPGEPVEIAMLSSTGLTFPYTIEVATATPRLDAGAAARFALLGIYVGVIPVALGIAWFPALRRMGRRGLGFLLYLTVGLLVFLAVDAAGEAWAIAAELPEAFHGPALFVLGVAGAWIALWGVAEASRRGQSVLPGSTLAWLVALGIGLHNMGEGLAIGSAYALGELTLGAMLVAGFTLHNATEGIAIVAPILDRRARLMELAGLGALAGVPTILGCWAGAFSYAQLWALLCLAVGVGAIAQVVAAIVGTRNLSEIAAPFHLAGLVTGYLLMYGTGLLVGAA